MHTYDVLFIADHFVMVTTVEMYKSLDKRDVEKAAWLRLSTEYGQEWVDMTKPFFKQVSVEDLGTSAPNEPEVSDE